MAISDKKIGPGEFQVIKEGQEEVIKVNFFGVSYLPSIEDSKICMSETIDKILQVPSVNRIMFSERRNYLYDNAQTQMLREIANLYNYFRRQKTVLSLPINLNRGDISVKLGNLRFLLTDLLKGDPLGAYAEVRRMIRDQKIVIKDLRISDLIHQETAFLNLLMQIRDLMEKTRLIMMARPSLAGYSIGDRSVYRNFFRPIITPNFIYTRLMADPPLDANEVDAYKLDDQTSVMILRTPGNVKNIYHLSPLEFNIGEEEYELLDLARNVLSEHQPKSEEFVDTEKIRKTFFNVGRDLLSELAERKRINLDFNQIDELAKILVRYTIGFGLVEVLLKDEKIQDITINGPIGETPIFILHQDYGECVTNIIPSREDGESWATKFRIISGRPLDEANPVMDTELLLPYARARVAVIGRPLNPTGLAFALRRHRDMPWTLPLFMKNRMLDSLTSGLLSFLIDGSRTMLIAGTRSSGKTSLLGSLMVEIMRKYRIITVEDTMELPVDSMRKLGYNIQPMKVRAALSVGGSEMGADEGIRTSLRMGDSGLIVGEIRSKEALALYEAMRIGALANVVAGTIHGGSPYSVFDRVVNDLGVPRTSFKATDIIVVANPIKTPDGLHKVRRVLSVTEVRKEWEDDPLKENGFVDLMKYNPKKDKLEPTQDLINGDSYIIKEIASSVKEYVGNWDAVWENIQLRAKIKQTLLDTALTRKMDFLLESPFVVKSNDNFHLIMDEISKEVGLDSRRIFNEWNDWFRKEIGRTKLSG